MAKTRYNPLQALQNDPLGNLKKATVERAAYESSSPATDPAFLDPGPQTSSPKVSAVHEERAESEGTRLSSAPVKPLSSSLKPSRSTVYLYPEDLTKNSGSLAGTPLLSTGSGPITA